MSACPDFFFRIVLEFYPDAAIFVRMRPANEEIFPIVDETGALTGQAARSVCHGGSMLLHPVVHLHVFNPAGELYLQKRAATKDIFPNRWDTSAGGHVGLGETPDEAVMREAREEIGLTGFQPFFWGKHIMQTEFERELTYCYYVITAQLPRPDMDELSDGRFWRICEIERQLHRGIFTPNFEFDFTQLRRLVAPVKQDEPL
jgi:isopentenyldiphosphate isomerase